MRIASTSSWKPGTVVTTVIVLRWQSVTVYDPVSSLFAAAEDHLRLWRCWGWWRRCWPWNPKNRSCWCVVEAKAWKEAQSEMWKCVFIGFFCFLTQSKWNLGYCMSLRLPAIWDWGPIQSSCHRSWMVLVTIASGETNKQNRCLGHILGHLLHMEPSRTKASVFCMFSMSNLSTKMHQQNSLLHEAAERKNAIPACGWGTQVHLDRMDLPIWTEFSVWVLT